MELKYGFDIQIPAIINNLNRLTNQIYKLLPMREEGVDWQTPLATLLEELSGMDSLFLDQHAILFSLICKLEGLFSLSLEDDFCTYRRIIFECLSLLDNLKMYVRAE